MNAVFKVSTTTHNTWETTERLLSASEAMDFVREISITMVKEPLGRLVSGKCGFFSFRDFDGAHQVTYLGEIIKDTSKRKQCSKCGHESFKCEGMTQWQCDNCIEIAWVKNMRGRANND